MEDWESIYRTKGVFQKHPSSRVLRAIESFKQNRLNRILDLGCGTGRHTLPLVHREFDVYGCDVSQEALDIICQSVPEGHFKCCDMTSLPYKDGFFDAIICNHVLQHGKVSDVQQAVTEMKRVLHSGGYLLLIVISTEHPKFSSGLEIEPNTKIDTDAVDGHVPHHFFTEEELRLFFQDFEVLRLEHFQGPSELNPEQESAAWELYARKQY